VALCPLALHSQGCSALDVLDKMIRTLNMLDKVIRALNVLDRMIRTECARQDDLRTECARQDDSHTEYHVQVMYTYATYRYHPSFFTARARSWHVPRRWPVEQQDPHLLHPPRCLRQH
jgi:hypothetical protein